MNDPSFGTWKEALHDRRNRLRTVLDRSTENQHLHSLLHQVDDALARLDHGTFGVCEVCHGSIEQERLIADPLVQVCLDCLTETQQRELEDDLELASSIQRTLLPDKQFRCDGWSIAYHYQPAGLVSGDYCDLMPLKDKTRTFFVLGDVSGKGVAASLMMSHLHAMFRSLLYSDMSLKELVERANRLFCESTLSTQFSTLVAGFLDSSGRVELVNAGHNPPVLVHANQAEVLEATGLPLGMFCSSTYELTTFLLEAGDSLLLYTDGYSETMRGEEEYGLDRIVELTKLNASLGPEALIQACLSDLGRYDGGAPRADDLSILAIHRMG